VNNSWTPCLEVAEASSAYISNDSLSRISTCAVSGCRTRTRRGPSVGRGGGGAVAAHWRQLRRLHAAQFAPPASAHACCNPPARARLTPQRAASHPQGYYDNRYWTMYKLPMFGCTDASQVRRARAADGGG